MRVGSVVSLSREICSWYALTCASFASSSAALAWLGLGLGLGLGLRVHVVPRRGEVEEGYQRHGQTRRELALD